MMRPSRKFSKATVAFFFVLLFLSPFASFCVPAEKLLDAVDDYLQSMPPLQRISLLFLVNIDGDEQYRALEYDDEKPLVPGGCLFFSYNIASSADKLIAFTQSIEGYCKSHKLPRPYIAVDQEGGGVNRLKELTSYLPSPSTVSSHITPQEAFELYSLQGEQMAALGFDLNLAPVVEALAPYNEHYLFYRSYGRESAAAVFSHAAVTAYQDHAVLCAVKHFPGNSNVDPHSGVSVIDIDEKELFLSIYLPFSFLLSSQPAAVLMSHALVPSVDPQSPAVLSKLWIEENLRKRFAYEGLVISDDIFMGALSSFDRTDLAVQAIQAGTDVIMLSDKYFKDCAQALLDEAEKNDSFAGKLHEAERKVVLFKLRAGLLRIQESADGSQKLVERSLAEQKGTADARIKAFQNAKARGDAFYESHFRGGKR